MHTYYQSLNPKKKKNLQTFYSHKGISLLKQKFEGARTNKFTIKVISFWKINQ